ncbi:MAG: DUF4175 family protein [Bacteroidota bacterium]|nr:DUF4175 family protein [Bacteroidota bacterium]
MQSGIEIVHHNLKEYKKKYYLNRLLKGIIIFASIVLASYYLLTGVAYFSNLYTWVRAILFYSFILAAMISFYYWVAEPCMRLFLLNNQISDEEAANQIGNLLPEVKDKLLNTLQLAKLNSQDSDLLQASIQRKSQELSLFNFSGTIKLEENRRYLPFLFPVIMTGAIILMLVPQFFTEGTEKIVKYNTEFIPKAPFDFLMTNQKLETFKDEDLSVNLILEGRSIPSDAYVFIDGIRQKMDKLDDHHFAFLFRNLKESQSFRFEAAGFYSKNYEIQVKSRPILNFFDVKLEYPAYLSKKTERLSNAGNLLVPQGTKVNWIFDTDNTDALTVKINNDEKNIESSLLGGYNFTYKAMQSTPYSLLLKNKHGSNKDKIEYTLTVIPDEYPKINVEQFRDTTLFSHIIFGGNLSDDYGITALSLFYKRQSDKAFIEKTIKIAKGQNNQNYYYKWSIDSLELAEGESLEYYLSVWDNDAINGNKATKSSFFQIKVPSKSEMDKSIAESSDQAEQQIESTLSKAEQLKKDVKKIEQKMKTKKTLDWQDKKAIEEMLKKQEELQKEVEEMSKKHEELMQKQDRFDKTSERIAEKTKMLQELMKDVLDEETKKMYQELAKLLQEKGKDNELKDLVEKLSKKEQNVEKELDRALEMFKQLKLETKLEDITQKMEELAKAQEELAKETEKADQKDEKKNEELKQNQEQLAQKFEDVKKEMDEAEKMNEELENKMEMESTEQEEKEISKEQKEGKESLDKKENKKAAKSQKNAADKMKEMAEKLKKMQESNEMEMAEENIEDLRQILDNLITLSYNQEDLMKEFKKVNQQDPRFIELSQKQLKLKDDSKIIEDSLYALSKRVFQIQSFITKELEDMNKYMDESSVAIKARRPDLSAGKQQFAMTSMNNLALMLSDVMQQMQNQMQDQKQKPGKGGGSSKSKGKKNCESGKPSMGQLQKQLNKQISELKKSGLSGSKLSEQLAKMARQQEQIRKAMQEEGKGGANGSGGSQGKPGEEGKPEGEGNGKEKGQGQGESEKLIKEMEQTEKDLVNKRITEELLQRQEEILTRLLEHEKAQREREQDNQRESEVAKEKTRKLPPAFEQLLKEKELQLELLRTIPPNLSPYYKRETGEYFEKLNK